MPNYIKQSDSYSCAPVAVLNAVRWAGNDIVDTQMLLEQLRIIAGTRKPDKKKGATAGGRGGTSPIGIEKAIKSRPELYLHRTIRDPSIIQIRQHIDLGYCVILTYKNKFAQTSGHAVFIQGRDKQKKTYSIVNDSGKFGPVVQAVLSEELRKRLYASKKSRMYRSYAWIIAPSGLISPDS